MLLAKRPTIWKKVREVSGGCLMGWIYLAELGAFNSAYLHGFPQSLIVRLTDTARECFCREWPTGRSQKPQYGTISEPSAANPFFRTSRRIRNEKRSILFREDSRARTSVMRALVLAWKEKEADLLQNSSDSSRNSNQLSFFSKMSLESEEEEQMPSRKDWPSFGMIVGGRLFQPKNLEPRIAGTVGSSLLPTPTASQYGTGGNGIRKGTQKQVVSLSTMARTGQWPTPTVKGNHNRKGASNKSGDGLATKVRSLRWPTPCASEGAKGGPGRKFGDGSPTLSSLSIAVGQKRFLNPLFVEFLMGYPAGWSVLEDWVTPWYRSRRGKPSKG